MLPAAPQVAQDVLLVAPGVLKCVSKDGQPIECPLLVDRFGKLLDGRREPRGVKGDGAKWQRAEDVVQE
jgi:hypothetical protein